MHSVNSKRTVKPVAQATKKPHYVPAKLLQAWCDSDGFVHCRRPEGSPFKSDPDNVAIERRLYRHETATEREFFEMIQLMTHHSSNPVGLVLLNVLRSTACATAYASLLKLGELDMNACRVWQLGVDYAILTEHDCRQLQVAYHLFHQPASREDIRQRLNKFLVNGHERFMTDVENRFWPVLDKLLSDVQPSELTEEEKIKALLFFIVQLARLPRIVSLWARTVPAKPGMKYFFLMDWIMSRFLLFGDLSSSFKIDVLHNATELPFITGDAPLMNLSPGGAKAEAWDLFFPISPTKAIFYAEDGRLKNKFNSLRTPNREDVHRLNSQLCAISEQFIFADSDKTILENDYKPRRTTSRG